MMITQFLLEKNSAWWRQVSYGHVDWLQATNEKIIELNQDNICREFQTNLLLIHSILFFQVKKREK